MSSRNHGVMLLLFLAFWLSREVEAGVDENNSTVAVTYWREMTVWEPPGSPAHPTPRIFIPTRTFWGRPIPGLASSSSCCGKVNTITRIVGGGETVPNAFPWMAAFVISGENIPFCGGSLISDRYVLTAAHCLYGESPGSIQVILGKHELALNTGNDLRLAISQIIIHPSYKPPFLGSDFALVKLQTPLSLPIASNIIAPICMPTRRIYFRERAVAAGWGLTQEGGSQPDRLHSVDLETLGRLVCTFLNGRFITSTMICASEDLGGGGKDTCQGDSGGPLMAAARRYPERQTLIGLSSWGIGCGRPYSPGVYARVTAVLDWLVTSTPDAVYC